MIHSIKVGGNAFLKHGIASSLHLLKMLILIKDKAVSSLLTYNEKFETDIPRIFQKRREGVTLYLTITMLFCSYKVNQHRAD